MKKTHIFGKPTRHGKTGTSIYNRWSAIVERCTNPKSSNYQNYGARGITLCDKWRTFIGFYEDMGDPPFPKAEIDRKDNDKGYSKENCHWTTRTVNNRNKRITKKALLDGRELPLKEIAEIFGITYNTLNYRCWAHGNTQAEVDRLVSEGVITSYPKVVIDGKEYTIHKAVQLLKTSRQRIRKYVSEGMSLQAAIDKIIKEKKRKQYHQRLVDTHNMCMYVRGLLIVGNRRI